MADITVTATSVTRVSGSVVTQYVAGETITAGQVVYLKTTDSKWYKAQCDGTAEEAGGSTQLGVALNGGASGQPLVVQTNGVIAIGGTVVIGTTYVVSTSAGGICPHADLVSTNRYTIVGYGYTAAQIALTPLATGLTIA